jgi:excisionase family DNA binding protein
MNSPESITPRLLNIQQAAKYLNCAVWTLRDLEWRGELPSVRNLGRRLLFDVRDLDQLVEQKKGGR